MNLFKEHMKKVLQCCLFSITTSLYASSYPNYTHGTHKNLSFQTITWSSSFVVMCVMEKQTFWDFLLSGSLLTNCARQAMTSIWPQPPADKVCMITIWPATRGRTSNYSPEFFPPQKENINWMRVDSDIKRSLSSVFFAVDSCSWSKFSNWVEG